MSDQPNLSNAAAFRDRTRKQEEGEVLELSSGMVVRVRRPNETKLIQNGQVPAALVMSAVNVAQQKLGPADLVNYTKLKCLCAKLTLVSPVVVEGDAANDNEITIDDLTKEEVDELYYYVSGGMDGLRQFREERQRLLAGSDMPPVPGDTAERPVRTQEPGQS